MAGVDSGARSPRQVLTLRRVLALVAVMIAVAVLGAQLWLSRRNAEFAIQTMNASAGQSLAFLVQQRVGPEYLQRLTTLADEWARTSSLVESTAAGDAAKAGFSLDVVMKSQPIATGDIRVRSLEVLTPDLKRLAHEAGDTDESITDLPDARAALAARDKAAQRKQLGLLWRTGKGVPAHSLIVPIGGFRVAGFLEIVSDPSPMLADLGPALGGTVQLFGDASVPVAESRPAEAGAADPSGQIAVEAAVPASYGPPFARVRLLRDAGAFLAETRRMGNEALAVTGGAIAVAGLIGLILLRVAVLSKLRAFAAAMGRIATGDLAIRIPATGPDELSVMADALGRLRDSVAEAMRVKQMVEASASPTAYVGTDGRVAYLNAAGHAFCTTHGLAAPDPSAPVGADLFGLGDDFARACADPESLPMTRSVRLDDTEAQLSVTAIRDGAGAFLGAMMAWTDVTAEARSRALARSMIREVDEVARLVADQARLLNELSAQLAERSTATVSQSDAARVLVDSSTEKTHSVAAATEIFSTGIRNVVRQAEEAADRAAAMRDTVAQADSTMRQLADAAQQIGTVVGLISGIAGQTKLLALNATIEAARAGDLGRGFAVVADEVKKLASETAEATDRIAGSIEGIRDSLGRAVASFSGISDSVGAVTQIQATIAGAVEHQTSTSDEIARTVTQIASDASHATALIRDVNAQAHSTGSIAADLLAAATRLSGEATALSGRIQAYQAQVA